MTAEDNKAAIRRFYEEVINQGKIHLIDELGTPDFVDHNPSPGQPPGLQGTKEFFTMLRAAFPDIRASVEDVIAEGDKVVSRITMRGTHRAEFAGIPATGKQVEFSVIDIVRMRDGKAVERWGIEDNLSFLQQLGVVPPPGG